MGCCLHCQFQRLQPSQPTESDSSSSDLIIDEGASTPDRDPTPQLQSTEQNHQQPLTMESESSSADSEDPSIKKVKLTIHENCLEDISKLAEKHQVQIDIVKEQPRNLKPGRVYFAAKGRKHDIDKMLEEYAPSWFKE